MSQCKSCDLCSGFGNKIFAGIRYISFLIFTCGLYLLWHRFFTASACAVGIKCCITEDKNPIGETKFKIINNIRNEKKIENLYILTLVRYKCKY